MWAVCSRFKYRNVVTAAPRRNRKLKVSLSQHSNGLNSYWRLHYTFDSKPHRPYFKTQKEAEAERKRLLELHDNIGTSGSELLATQAEQQDAAAALKILAPHGRSLMDMDNVGVHKLMHE